MASARIQLGDWLELARGLAPASVDFLYADPPFNTGAPKRTPPSSHKRRSWRARGAGGAARSIPVRTCYGDCWPSMPAYIAWLRERVVATLPAMKGTGVVAIHCDFRACHHVRLLLDGVLSGEHFVNHLIWSYGLGGSSPRRFARKHDDILVYAVDPRRYYFEAPMVPATSRRLRGQLKKATDVLDIASLNNMARERTGYPTQKPLALMDVLVRAFCPVGGMVLDPCCGSGTTEAAALGSGRGAMGWDANAEAVRIARERLGPGAG